MVVLLTDCLCFFFKQKTAYEMRISDWSSDVCSSDLLLDRLQRPDPAHPGPGPRLEHRRPPVRRTRPGGEEAAVDGDQDRARQGQVRRHLRSEEHTSELQSLMRISYAVFCLKKKNTRNIKSKHLTIKNSTHICMYNI